MGEAEKKEDDEKLIPVGPGAEGLPEAKRQPEEPDDGEDERLAQKSDEDDDAGAHGERKRESAKERRERAKKARDRERLERDFLLKRNEELEKRFMALEQRQSQTETVAVDQRINAVKAQITNADRVLLAASRKPNGEGEEEYLEAQRIRDELRDQLSKLSATKQERERETAAPEPRERAPKAPDPRVIRNAREWADQHDWFDFHSKDEDSRIVRAIDETLSGEGYDPATSEYWEELTARVKRRLPERFKNGARSRADDDGDDVDDTEEKPKQPSGPKFSSGGRERPLRKGEVYVSAERKQAMKEYGVWDDPVARARMLKRYAAWDAEVAARKS